MLCFNCPTNQLENHHVEGSTHLDEKASMSGAFTKISSLILAGGVMVREMHTRRSRIHPRESWRFVHSGIPPSKRWSPSISRGVGPPPQHIIRNTMDKCQVLATQNGWRHPVTRPWTRPTSVGWKYAQLTWNYISVVVYMFFARMYMFSVHVWCTCLLYMFDVLDLEHHFPKPFRKETNTSDSSI